MMATHPHDAGRASTLPLPAALALIPRLPRPMLARFVARAIERLDEEDGDPDLEDATNAEDEGLTGAAALSFNMRYPGCPVSDPGGGAVDDEGEDGSG